MYKNYLASILFLLLLCGLTYPQTVKNSGKQKPEEVKIAGTQLQKFHSQILRRDFEIYINLPRFYSDTSKKFPVIYLLDGQWDFPLVQSIYGQQYYDGFMPGVITAGIVWGGVNPNFDSLRAMDLTPTHMNRLQQSGNGGKFLRFIKEELIPFVDSNYRTDKSNRTLIGSSFGGLFTLYAMFNETNLFGKYVLTSPAIDWDNGFIFKEEEQYAKGHDSLPVRLFMGIGEYEDTAGFNKFAGMIKEHNFKGLELETKVLQGMGHSGGKAEGFTRGLQFVFKRADLRSDILLLKQYAGSYTIGPGVKIKLAIESGRLIAITPDNQKVILHAETDKDFYVIGAYANLYFQKDGSGRVLGFRFEQYNGNNFFKKD